MIVAGVADTHTAIWYLFDDARLSPTAGNYMDAAADARQKIAVSSISLAEVVYLIEKNRLIPAVYDEFTHALKDPDHVFMEAAFTIAITQSMRQIPRDKIPDMPDRIIAATALHLSVPVISRDRRILSAGLSTIW